MTQENRTLYLECTGGIAGDMVVGALLDLGADEDKLKQALASLPLSGYKINISRVTKSGIDACDFDVILDEDNHDHDIAYLYGDTPHDDHEHHHDHAHHHEHRHLKEIREIIDAGGLTDRAKQMALSIFEIIAKAEGKAHNTSPEAVHFHEVGAVDAIVDIVSAAVCLDDLDIDAAYISPLSEGQGTVRCQHGVLPIPVPAVANIVTDSDLKLRITNRRGEWVTPTGAAIAAALDNKQALPDAFTIDKIGIGAGKRDYHDGVNILRAMMIEADEPDTTDDTIIRLETNVDDANGEMLGHVLPKLFDAGARDAFFVPIMMKKNRPATELVVITDEAHRKAIEAMIFSETTTIGIRRQTMRRSVLARDIKTVTTPLGDVQVKCVTVDGKTRLYPEYASVAALCESTGRPYPDVLAAVTAALQDA